MSRDNYKSVDNKKNDSKTKTIILWVILAYLFLGMTLPVVFKYAIFESTAYSNLTNSEWAGFLGSYVGGVLGALGTLVAVYFTVKSTINVQEEATHSSNERLELEYRRHQEEIKSENERREKERQDDSKEIKTRYRIELANEIANDLGKYITHISNYYYMNQREEKIKNKLVKAKQELDLKENEIKEITRQLQNVSVEENIQSIHQFEMQMQQKEIERQRALRVYGEYAELERRNGERLNRFVANEAYFTIRVRMNDLQEGKSFLEKLEKIHKEVSYDHPEEKYGQWIEGETDGLMREFDSFVKMYISR